VYWTIIVDGQPTAFRSGSLEDIMPTFNRLKEKQPSAELKWFQNGQLWASRHDAQDFMRARGERGRAKDPRPASSRDSGSGFRGPRTEQTERPERAWNAKPEWKTRSTFSSKADKPRENRDAPAGERPVWVPKGAAKDGAFSGGSLGAGDKPAWKPKRDAGDGPARQAQSWGEDEDRPSFPKATDDRPAGQARSDRKPEWKPKGTFKPKEAGHASGWGEKPAFAPRSSGASARQAPGGKPAWSPKGDKPAWKPKTGGASGFSRSRDDKPAWRPKGDSGGKPAWKPKGDAGDKPAWKPKGTFKPREEGHRPSARDQARSSFKPKSYTPKVDDGRTRSSRVQSRNDKLEWTAKAAPSREGGPNAGFAKSDPDGPKRKWVPKAEYKKSLGIEAKKDSKWRPGGDHVDPKQKYKDAKKAKWTKFKANIRARSTKPRKQEE